MTDWIKTIQSIGRGFRPGMEIKVISAGNRSGKSVIMDMESDTFTDWEHVLRPHYVQMYAMGSLAWFRYSKKPMLSILYEAIKVVRHNKDGSFEYLKNRDGTGGRVLNEEEEKEFVFTILKATEM
jgi:hypothetical protein